jgi:hypothetical protein
LIDQRPDHGVGVVGIADFQPAHLVDEALDEFVVDFGVDHQPVDRHANLPLVQKFADHGGVDGNFHIRIVENHRGRIAAELEQHSFEDRALRRQLHDPPADFGRAGEGNHPRHRMAHEGIADHAAGADDDIEHAGGNPRFFVNLRQQRAAGHRRVEAGFHHRVARRPGATERLPDETENSTG